MASLTEGFPSPVRFTCHLVSFVENEFQLWNDDVLNITYPKSHESRGGAALILILNLFCSNSPDLLPYPSLSPLERTQTSWFLGPCSNPLYPPPLLELERAQVSWPPSLGLLYASRPCSSPRARTEPRHASSQLSSTSPGSNPWDPTHL